MGTGAHAESLLPVLGSMQPYYDGNNSLSDNPWELPPAAVVSAGADSIRCYYEELKQRGKDPEEIQSLKVVFAGHSGAGKTRYVRA